MPTLADRKAQHFPNLNIETTMSQSSKSSEEKGECHITERVMFPKRCHPSENADPKGWYFSETPSTQDGWHFSSENADPKGWYFRSENEVSDISAETATSSPQFIIDELALEPPRILRSSELRKKYEEDPNNSGSVFLDMADCDMYHNFGYHRYPNNFQNDLETFSPKTVCDHVKEIFKCIKTTFVGVINTVKFIFMYL